MAAITTAGSGNWTSTTVNAPWPSGTVPTNADDVTIAKNHVVTLDATTCVANTVTLAVGTTGADNGGQLTCSTSASSKLTLQAGITSPGSTTVAFSTYLNFDMRSASAGVVCEIVQNAAHGTNNGITASGSWNMRGLVKKRWSTINSALVANTTKSVVIADCTGWVVGDKLIFATTSAYSATPATDEVTIATITPGAGTTATVTWTDGLGTGGAVANAHAANCPVGNFSSNLILRPNTSGQVAFFHANGSATSSNVDQYFTDVEVRGCKNGTTQGAQPIGINTSSNRLTNVSNNALYNYDTTAALYLRSVSKTVTRQYNIFYSSVASAGCGGGQDVSGLAEIGPDEYYCVFRSANGLVPLFMNQHQNGHWISGITSAAGPSNGGVALQGRIGVQINDCSFWSSNAGISVNTLGYANRCVFGSSVFSGCDNSNSSINNGPGLVTMTDCVYPSNMRIIGLTAGLPNAFINVVNKNADPAVQEIYGSHSLTVPIIQRDTSLASTGRSTSAVLMTMNAATAVTQAFQVLTKAGQTINIQCLVRKSSSPAYGASTLPSVTISGLGITPVVTTMAGGTAADTWETLTCSATNSGSADGLLTVTFTGQSATAGAKCWFSGVPIAPFVSRCRHYGYTFDEASPTRTVNITTSAAEATAAVYTGMTVTWGTSLSTVALSADQTFQKLYDYTQAQACLSVGSAVPLTGAGVAGSPALFAAGALTTTGYTVNGAGSISMGSFVLTASVPWVYTYTGGTFSQATTVPSFNGGTLAIGASGTYTYTQAGSTLLQVTPTSPSSYTLSSGSFTGTLTVNNMAAHAVTIYVPSGTTTSSTGNTGGAITFSAPIVQQSVTLTGVLAGSRVQIYDTTNSVELFNGTSGYTWTDPSAAVGTRDIRIRISYVSGATAKEFIETSVGTCGITSPSNAITYLVSQTNDTTYNSNAVDGSAVTGITFTDAATDLVNCNIGGGSVAWPSIYAAFVYWNFTAVGIANDFTYVSAPDTANYLLSGMKIRNTSAVALSVISGYGRDATTGESKDIIDTAGSTGNIFLAPDHVVAFATGSGVTAGDITLIAAASATAVVTDPSTLTVPKFIALS